MACSRLSESGTASPRVLFVDDDAQVLGGLRNVFRKQRDRWDMVFALGGPDGLDQIDAASFDVVISDMRMPQLDGAALLGRVRERDPTTIRMILSGFADREAMARAIPVAQRFFDKPCDFRGLRAAIERGCALRAAFFGDPLCAQARVDAAVGHLGIPTVAGLGSAARAFHALAPAGAEETSHRHALVAALIDAVARHLDADAIRPTE